MAVRRFYRTVRYLRTIQIINRIRYKFAYVRPNFAKAPPIRIGNIKWTQGIDKRCSIKGPDTFRFLNNENRLKYPNYWDDGSIDKLWRYNLHYFDYLISCDSKNYGKLHAKLLERWIADNPPGVGTGWEPYPTSLRIVNWIKWSLAGNQLSESAIHSLAIQVRWLTKHLEYHILGNHLFANAKALVFAGLFFDGADSNKWLKKGLYILNKQMPEQILEDGGHIERSPMYHAIILEDILDLININNVLSGCLQSTTLAEWKKIITNMLNWLEVMSHPDGEIGLFNDAAFGVAPKYIELTEYAKGLGIMPNLNTSEVKYLKDSGYVKILGVDISAILDVGEIGPDYQPGHAHADTLTFEISLFGERVIVNSGTSLYGISDERLRQRGTTAHNTIKIDNIDSSEVWSGFRVGRRAYPIHQNVLNNKEYTSIEACHTGYLNLPGKPLHCRKWDIYRRKIVINDTITGDGEHKIISNLHIHPGVEIIKDNDGQFSLVTKTGKIIKIECAGFNEINICHSTYHPQFGVSIPNSVLKLDVSNKLPAKAKIIMAW